MGGGVGWTRAELTDGSSRWLSWPVASPRGRSEEGSPQSRSRPRGAAGRRCRRRRSLTLTFPPRHHREAAAGVVGVGVVGAGGGGRFPENTVNMSASRVAAGRGAGDRPRGGAGRDTALRSPGGAGPL